MRKKMREINRKWKVEIIRKRWGGVCMQGIQGENFLKKEHQMSCPACAQQLSTERKTSFGLLGFAFEMLLMRNVPAFRAGHLANVVAYRGICAVQVH